MTVTDVLKAARESIARPGGWAQLSYHGVPDRRDGVINSINDANCPITAINANSEELRRLAREAFAKAAGLPDANIFTITDWNDAPERTKAEVLAAFDRAIADAEAPVA